MRFVEEVEGVVAEVMDNTGRRGEHGRRGYGERRRRALFGRGRERGQRGIGTEGETRESGERCKGSRGVHGTLGCLQRRAGKQEVAGAWPACGEHALVLLSREEDDREAAVVGWAAAGLHSVGLRVGCQVS